MRLVRFYCMGRSRWGQALDEGVRFLEGSPFEGSLHPSDHVLSWEAVEVLPCSLPTKIVCVGSNYRAHCEEMGRPLPEVPTLFLKPPSALLGDGGVIQLPANAGRVDFEGELAVVIGRRTRRVSEADAAQHILGCTVLNDVTARDIQNSDVQFTRAKGFDTFCPLGPLIANDVNPADLELTTRVNDVVRQDSRTSDMVFSIPYLVSFISHHMTLEAGDVISTGTPSGVGPLSAGDTVAVTIEGIGTLTNGVEEA